MSIDDKMKIVELLAKSGMKVNNLIVEHNGDNYFYEGKDREEKHKVTDEQIARALVKINGKQNVVDSQRAWLGVCCLLGWKYNFPRNLMDCCKRIETLPIENEKLEFQCKYESIRMFGSWKFVKEDYKEWPHYTPRDDERQMFEKCLAVAHALDAEIEKQQGCDS